MSELWEKIREFASDFIDAIIYGIKSVFAWFAELIFDLIAGVIESLPPPEFMDQSAASHLPSDVLYFLNVTGFHECLAVIAAGIIFYFLRRILTLGIW